MNNKAFLGLALVVLLGSACSGKSGPNSSSQIAGLKKVHFEYDRSVIPSEMVDTLNKNATFLKKNAKLDVVIEGHCDSRGSTEYNLALGDRRATAVKQYLSRQGVKNNLRSVSYGEERPVSAENTESGWYQNRRAEFVRR